MFRSLRFNKSIMKVSKKVIKFTDKSCHALLNNFLLALLRTQQSYQSTHPLHKHKPLRTFPVFCSGRNEFYNQNIPHCILLSLIIYFTFL